MKNNNNVLLASLLILSSIVLLGVFPFQSPKAKIMNEPHNFVKLTNLQGTSGGTGFSVRAPSGKLYTMTNAHVCDGVMTEDGFIYGHDSKDDDRVIQLRVLEVSDFTDLCLVEPMPNATGLDVSSVDAVRNDKLFVLGYPSLEPLQYAEGLMTANIKVTVPLFEVKLENCTLPKHKMIDIHGSFFGIPVEMTICALSLDAAITNIKIYPGNSGSPVLNESGEIVGVVFAAGNTANASIIKRADVVKLLSIR